MYVDLNCLAWWALTLGGATAAFCFFSVLAVFSQHALYFLVFPYLYLHFLAESLFKSYGQATLNNWNLMNSVKVVQSGICNISG